MRRTLLAAALVAGAACAPPAATAPVLSLTAEPGDVDEVVLSWATSITGDYSGFVLESRQPGGGFVPVAALGPKITRHRHRFPAAVPEDSDQEFRLRVIPDEGGRTSNTVRFHRGLRAPTFSVLWTASGFALHITNRSQAAEALRLVRRSGCERAGVAVDRTLELPPDTAGFLDEDLAALVDGRTYSYELTAVKGAAESARAAPWPFWGTAPLFLPEGLSVERLGGGLLRARYLQASACATTVSLVASRADGAGVALPASASLTPPPPAGTVVTVDLPVGAPGAYAFKACVGTYSCSGVTPVVVPPATLDASLPEVPSGDAVVRTPGGFATASTPANNLGALALSAPGPAGADLLAVSRAAFEPRGLAVDAAGHPHAVWAEQRTTPSDSVAIVHGWHDGIAWSQEDVLPSVPWTTSLSYASAPVLAVGADGTLHVALRRSGVLVLSQVAGVWQARPETGYTRDPFVLAGDPLGAPHLVYAPTQLGATHLAWDGVAWASEAVTGATSNTAGASVRPLHLAAGTSGLTLVWEVPDSAKPSVLTVTRRAAGSGPWTAPATLPARAASSSGQRVVAAQTVDGERVAVGEEADGGPGVPSTRRLHLVDGAGVTSHDWFAGDTWAYAWRAAFAVGFGQDGRAWLLENAWSTPPANAFPPILFEEPAP